MVNYKNTGYDVIEDDKDTFPRSSAKTGTIAIASGSTQVNGTSTLFLTEMKIGGYLFNATDNEVRRIENIVSATSLSIDKPFTSVISGAAPVYVPESECVEVSVFIPTGLTAGEIDGVSFPAGVGITWGKTGRTTSARRDHIDPVVLDATGTTICIQYLK